MATKPKARPIRRVVMIGERRYRVTLDPRGICLHPMHTRGGHDRFATWSAILHTSFSAPARDARGAQRQLTLGWAAR